MKAPLNNLCRSAAFELRADTHGDGHTLEGYAAVFDSPTRIDSWEGTFDETIIRGAFRKTISERTPVLQFDHGRDVATGSVPIGSIETIREDKTGLFVSARLHDNARVEPIRQAIESGAIDGMSFRFRVLREEWDETGDIPARMIREVDLFELGPVVFPAYEATSVGVRTLLADLDDDDRNKFVRELAETVFDPKALAQAVAEGDLSLLARTDPSDAAPDGTSDAPSPPDAGDAATSVPEPRTYAQRQQDKRRLLNDALGITKE